MHNFGTLVSCRQLAEVLFKCSKNLRVIDATWFLPNSGLDAFENYKKGHIPGAQFFDIDQCCSESPYEHTLPSPSQFEEYVGNLGIDNDTHVVIYNDHPDFALFSAPRVWWTFRLFGHNSVSLLEGGLGQWRDEQLNISTGIQNVEFKKFKASLNENWVKSFEQMVMNIHDKQFQVIDARSEGRFNGTAPEPRPDTRPGHIPGSMSMPFTSIQKGPYVSKMDGTEVKLGLLKSVEEMKKEFADRGVDLTRPITATCGSGVSACNLVLAAHLCGKEDVSVYDGSWVEWYKRSSPQQRKNSPEDS